MPQYCPVIPAEGAGPRAGIGCDMRLTIPGLQRTASALRCARNDEVLGFSGGFIFSPGST